MIIFYEKETGKIVGKIDGRKHSKHVLEKVWIGKNTNRLIIDWKRTGSEFEEETTQTKYDQVGVDLNGKPIFKELKEKIVKKKRDYEPQCQQKKLLSEIERRSKNIFDYKIKDGKLVKN